MKKKEIIWREILYQGIEQKKFDFTQQELAQKYQFSLSTVFNAIKVLRPSGIITVHGRGFKLINIEKFLYLWGTARRLSKDIIYQTHYPAEALEIEAQMPPEVIFGAFSAYLKKYQDAPSEYDKVYLYLSPDHLNRFQERFPAASGPDNVFVLAADPWLKDFGSVTPDGQTFADLWSLPEWYAKDFAEALKERII